ncbi:hypothetical protein [Cellvibrio sp. QJXJ]|uniref:hypothetical protein n=1 Tax=Cellvibrio sp. QJXJ TaxID=2964606 RepID=UPI0021C3EF00|nr:hypothetical protein [Cellvibrio sp. QJXJ]UUA73564.1 hypothetical protein NNX04_03735 [Cellvibrio sp. QJXJ]
MDFFKSTFIESAGLTPAIIADYCGVSVRTAQRWLAGRTKPSHAAQELLLLKVRRRIMPSRWPEHWFFNCNGDLEAGTNTHALAWQHLDWYSYSLSRWTFLLSLIPQINKRLDELQARATPAQVIELDKYRKRLAEVTKHEFLLPERLTPLFIQTYGQPEHEPQEKITHRKIGC